MGMHKLLFEEGVLPDNTELEYHAQGKMVLTGKKQGRGILCSCCNSVVSASRFEAHAGYASRRKPYDYIYTRQGVSLHNLMVSLYRKRSLKDGHNLSNFADDRNLASQDFSSSVFLPECTSVSGKPRAGLASRVEPIQCRSKGCTESVRGSEVDDTKCALCGGSEYLKSGFGPTLMLLCDQCDREYHIGCLKDHNMADLEELPEGNWFCCLGCRTIHSKLMDLVSQGAQKLPEHLATVIKEKCQGEGSEDVGDSNVCWQLINSAIAPAEALISEAINIFKEAFSAMTDEEEPDMIKGHCLWHNKYRGMYCAVLTVNSVVKSVGAFRVFGSKIAELPLVATTKHEHGRGYCRVLFTCMEMLFASLNVQSIVLPAAKEAKAMWMSKFGFSKMSKKQINHTAEITSGTLVRFGATSMLCKQIVYERDSGLQVTEENSKEESL